jgi:hypothetical protein
VPLTERHDVPPVLAEVRFEIDRTGVHEPCPMIQSARLPSLWTYTRFVYFSRTAYTLTPSDTGGRALTWLVAHETISIEGFRDTAH